MRGERRAFVSALARHAGVPSRHFVWRRVHCTLECGRASRESRPRFERIGIDESQLLAWFNAETADRAGEVVHVVVSVYMVDTYVPAVPIMAHSFDFDLEPPRSVEDLAAADVIEMFNDECAFQRSNPWTEPLQYLRRVEPVEPYVVRVQDEHRHDQVDTLWCCGELFDSALLCDGNRRFGLAYPSLRGPFYGGRMYPDLAEALLAGAWK